MPFEPATDFIKEYLDQRKTLLINTRRLKWSTDGQGTLKEMIDDKFDRTIENDEWERRIQKRDDSKANIIIGLRNKIGWQAAGNRDLRSQFASEQGCRQRVALDHTRYGILRLDWAWKGLKRFIDIVAQRLATP